MSLGRQCKEWEHAVILLYQFPSRRTINVVVFQDSLGHLSCKRNDFSFPKLNSPLAEIANKIRSRAGWIEVRDTERRPITAFSCTTGRKASGDSRISFKRPTFAAGSFSHLSCNITGVIVLFVFLAIRNMRGAVFASAPSNLDFAFQ